MARRYPRRPPDDDDTENWLSEFVPTMERERMLSDLKVGTLPGDDERTQEYATMGRTALSQAAEERRTFLDTYGKDYPKPSQDFGIKERVLKPIGQGLVDTAKDVGGMVVDLFSGTVPTKETLLGRKPPKPAAMPSLEPPLPTKADTPIDAPADPTKPTVPSGPPKTTDVPTVVPYGSKPDGTPNLEIKTRKRTKLNPEQEDQFQAWYRDVAQANKLDPNPDHIDHKYDMRGFWRSGMQSAPDPTDVDPETGKSRLHFPSKFKDDDHPNRFVLDGKNILDTKYNRPVPSNQFYAVATPQQKAQLEQHMVQAGQSFQEPAAPVAPAVPELPDIFTSLPGMAEQHNLNQQAQAKQLMELQRPGAVSPIAGVPNMEPPKPLSLGEAFEQAGLSTLRGAGNTTGLTIKGLGLWKNELDNLMGYQKKDSDSAAVRLGDRLSKWSKETFKGRPDLAKNFLLTTLFEGAGSSLPFLATGAAGATIGAGPGTVAAITGAAAGSAGLVEQAPKTATDAQKRLGLVLGAALGATEGVPIADLFHRLNTATGGTLSTALKSGAVQAIEEALQEGVQQLGENTVKKYLYGIAGQQLNEGVAEGMGAGGMLGFLMGFMISGKGRLSAASDAGSDKGKEQAPPTGPTAPPDLGAVPQAAGKEKTPKLGDRVNQEVQKIADQFPMPSLETKKGAPPKKVAKNATSATQQEAATSATPDRTRDQLPTLEPPARQEQPGPSTYRFDDGTTVKGKVATVAPQPAPSLTPQPTKEDAQYEQAKAVVTERGRPSASLLQRKLQIDYQSAARLLERMEKEGLVSPADKYGARTLVTQEKPKPVVPPPDKIDDDMREALEAENAQEEDLSKISEGGKAIADHMYDAMFEKVKKGDTQEGGQESVYLQAAKPVYEAGGIKDVEDMRAFTGDIEGVTSSDLKGEERNRAIRDIIESWTPKIESMEPAGAPSLEELYGDVENAKETLADFEDPTSAVSEQEKAEQREELEAAQRALEDRVKKLEDAPWDPVQREQDRQITEAQEASPVVDKQEASPWTGNQHEDGAQLVQTMEGHWEVQRPDGTAVRNTVTGGNQFRTAEQAKKAYDNTIDVTPKPQAPKALPVPALEAPQVGESPKAQPPALEAPAQKATVAEAEKAFNAATSKEEKQQHLDTVAQMRKDFIANPPRVNRAEYNQRRKVLDDALARMNQAIETKPAKTPSSGTPAYKVTEAELVPVRGADGKVKWVTQNVKEESYPAQPETPVPSLEPAAPTSETKAPVSEKVNHTLIKRGDIQVGDRYFTHNDGYLTVEKVHPYDPKYPKSQVIETDRGRRDIGHLDTLYVDRAEATPSLEPPQSTIADETKGATVETAAVPSLEGGSNEQPNQPGVADTRPSQGEPAETVPSLEATESTDAVREEPGDAGPQPARPTRGQRPGAVRGVGKGEGQRTPTDRGGRSADERDDTAVSRPEPTAGHDFSYEEGFAFPTGQKAKFRANVDAIKLVKQLDAEGRLATPDEQAVLAKFTGWGGLPQAFQWSREWGNEVDELEKLLTDDEYKAARASTPNAHYTDPQTIRAIYRGLAHLGFKGGKMLEPGAGSGLFLGVMPSGLAAKTHKTAIELDTMSARIAHHLYQRANVINGEYQSVSFPNNFFDVAVGNVPFANIQIFDPNNKDLTKLRLSLHDYYFAKALTQVRPGGIVAFITSRYTMDKVNGKMRDYVASKADLLGAIRLPNTQFKAIANTDVTTDILVFQRREDNTPAAGEQWAKTETVQINGEPIVVNEYFKRHPEQIMGKLATTGTMYSRREPTVENDGRDMSVALDDAFKRLPQNVMKPRKAPASVTTRGMLEALEASDDVKEGGYTIQGNALYIRRGPQFVPVEDAGPTVVERAKGLLAVRDQVREVLKTQLAGNDEVAIKKARADLNKVYDKFVKKWGLMHDQGNRRLFRGDPDYPTLQALEKYDKSTKTAKKADIFHRRVIEFRPKTERVETAKEAMLVAMNDTGRVDIERMKELTGKTQADLFKELQGIVFMDPEATNEWQPADLYLTGNVRQKLKAAQAAAKIDPRYQENVNALEAVQPKDLTHDQIHVKLGHGWIPTDVYAGFLDHLFDVSGSKVHYNANVGAYAVQAPVGRGNTKNDSTWGTQRAPATEIIQDALHSQMPTVYDTDQDGKRHLNEKETFAAREKLEKIQAEFVKWLWSDPARTQQLARLYNDEFNAVRLREYDGSHLTLPGANPLIKLRPHQKNGIWRALQNGNTLLNHVVGAGKTYTMIGIGMEARRLRMANKPMYVVPNHLTEYWGKAILQLYPAAKVLVPTKEDFKKERRQQLLSRIATGDWDGVVIAHSQLQKLPISLQAFKKFVDEQVKILAEYIQEIKAEKGGGRAQRNLVKELEKSKKRLEEKLKAREKAVSEKADNAITFEESGVDMLMVDEADLFKNLFFPTRMTRVAGLPNTESQRAYDLFLKTKYLNDLTGQRGVHFGTGTPLSNSMAEAFTMQRYLQPKALEEAGLQHFDSWARQFGNVVVQMELAPDGSGYRPRSRFAEFVNVPELLQMFRQVMDVRLAEDLKLPVPKMKGGGPINVTSKPSPALEAYTKELIERAANLKNVDPRDDNMLKITGDGRNAALDIRLRVPGAPEDKNGKVVKAVASVLDLYKRWAPIKGTQLVFLDLSTPKGEGKAKKKKGEAPAPVDEDAEEIQEEVELEEEAALRGSVYQDIKKKLMKNGIPEKEIAFIHDANTEVRKEQLYGDVNAGRIRVLIGSTEKLGAGTNVQQRLVGLHSIDAPWRPRDLEQREGRILRQGNLLHEFSEFLKADKPMKELPEELAEFAPHAKLLKDFEVEVRRYATEAPSFDVYMWQTLESKAKAIAQIMRGDANTRTIQDIDTAVMSYAEMKAIASGNPMILERVKVETDLRKLHLLQSQHKQEQDRMRYEIRSGIPGSIANEQETIAVDKKMQTMRDRHPAEPFSMEIDETKYTDLEEAGKAILTKFQEVISMPGEASFNTAVLGSYRGFMLELTGYRYHKEFNLLLSLPGTRGALLRTTNMDAEVKPEGIVERLENQLARIEKTIAAAEEDIVKLEKRKAQLEEEVKKPFERQAEIDPLEARLKTIDKALDLSKKDTEQAISTDAPAEPKKDDDEDTGPLGILKSERGSIPVSQLVPGGSGAGSQADVEAYRQQRAQEEIGFQSSDPEIERRVREAKKGLQPESLRSRIKEKLNEMWRHVSREFEHLPDTAQFARLRNDLLKLQKYKGIAADQIQRELASIIKPLNRKQYDQFEWKALLMDLKQEAEAERKLPFGYTPETVATDLENLDAAIERDPKVREAWEKRQQLWARLKREYQTSMDAIGFDTSKKLTKDDYFRHQVLNHARDQKLRGTGSSVRTPTGRGFLKTRAGSSMDINANYVQAEFEVMAQMVYDTQLAKVIKGVDETLNIRPQLEAEARKQNKAFVQQMIDEGGDAGKVIEATLADFKRRIGMHMGMLKKALGLSKDDQISLEEVRDIAVSEDTGYLSARGVWKAINERRAYLDQLLGKNKVTWEDLVPETHDTWQPREGNIFYMADSIPAQLAKQLQEGMLAEAGFPVDKLRKVLAMGAEREQYVIPVEAKQTLEGMTPKEDSVFIKLNRQFLGHWKQLMLIAPRKLLRYNLRNLTGDGDALFVGNPGAFLKLRQATKDLLPVMFGDTKLTGEAKRWVERGGYGTTLQFQELGQLNDLKAFQVSLDRASKGGVLSLPAKAWNAYWKSARLSTDYREAMFRYAAYLDYLEQMQKNEGRPNNFGASRKETVMALPDIRDRAFKLSNELLGAYDRVSVAGQTIRAFWIPFFSWMEVNATRYGRLVANALDGGHGGTSLARGALITGKNAASFMVRLAFFWSTLQAWNYLVFGDDEEELKQTNPTVANRPHILFGRDDEGKIMYLAGIGALGDLLSWFGLDAFPGLVGDIMHDRLTVGEAIRNAAKAPVNRIWQSITPAVKLPPELFMRETSYPDVFHWRPIQDRAEYLGYQTTLGPEIKALMGKPGRPLYGAEDLTGLVVQRTDPKSSAYFSWQSTERKYLERMGKDSPSVFWRTPRGEALNNWAIAIRDGDQEAETTWREKYVDLEKEKYGTRFSEARMYKDIERSLRAKAPLAGMSKDDRAAVLKELDDEEKDTLRRAEQYYKDVIMQVLPSARRTSLERRLQSQGWLSKGQPAGLPSLEP